MRNSKRTYYRSKTYSTVKEKSIYKGDIIT